MREIICSECGWENPAGCGICENCGYEFSDHPEKTAKTVWRVSCPHGNWHYDFQERPEEKYPFKECPCCVDPRDKRDIAEVQAVPTVIYIERLPSDSARQILTLVNTWSKEQIEITEDEGFLGWEGSVHPEFFSKEDGISRKHASFSREKDRWYIKHEEGQILTKLNGADLKPERRYQIKNKDTIIMGRVKFEIKIGESNHAD